LPVAGLDVVVDAEPGPAPDADGDAVGVPDPHPAVSTATANTTAVGKRAVDNVALVVTPTARWFIDVLPI